MITCQQLAELVSDYVEGRLGVAERLRFELHLGLCVDCRNYLEQVKLTARSLGRLPEPELPPALKDELLRRFSGWKRSGA